MTSEVGSDTSNQENGGTQDKNHWKELFEEQNRQFMSILSAFGQPAAGSITLPEFDPNSHNADAKAWITMANMCIGTKELNTSDLLIILNKALKGEALTWLSQVSFLEMKWADFKKAFEARFDITETTAAALIRLQESRPKEGDSCGAYASTWLTSVLARLKDLSSEEIAVALTMAHVAKFKPKVRHIAFTTEVRSRNRMQRELSAIHEEPEHKKFRPGTPPPIVKCFVCGKRGHKAATCEERLRGVRSQTMMTNVNQMPKKIVCFKCNQVGHIASNCPDRSMNSAKNKDSGERHVNICEVEMPTGSLQHNGTSYQYQYDCGSECSLARASIFEKLSGESFNKVIFLVGITKDRIQSTQQINCNVIISNNELKVFLHIVPDRYLKMDILLGREILAQGFAAEMDAHNFNLKKICIVESTNVNDKFLTIGTDFSQEYKVKLIKLLNEFRDSFADDLPSSRVNTGELKIRLIEPNRIVQRRPYRYAPKEREIIREKVSALLKVNIIRPSSSPFASPVVLAEKKDGSQRMCVDYRELNSNTVPDRYPLPLIADQIPRLHGTKFFTHLDCASGFHLIPIEEKSIECTAFVTQDGQYEWVTMPFGLRNAVSVFQRAITNALGDLVHEYVVIYVDDILILAENESQGLERLHIVLSALSRAGFALNMKKCTFFKRKAQFLGFEIESGKLKPNNRKIVALSELPPPSTVTQVRQFIGLASYFRQFIQGFSKIAAPLHKLTSLQGKLVWNEYYEKIRQQIIDILTNEPVLMIFKPDCPIELHTDASSDGYGAILFQIYEEKKRVVAYYSKRTTPAESKYHSYELETLAVVNAVKHFRSYLFGQKFTVVSDCNSLKASQTKIDLTPRVHRWWAFLQSFDFDVVYREGNRMQHVDFLSRNFELEEEEKLKEIQTVEVTDNWLKAEQRRDEEIVKIIADLENEVVNEELFKTYLFRSGVLYRRIQRNHVTKCLPYLPRALRWSVVHNFHDSLIHLGHEKTLEKLYDFYWFPGMNRYVRKFIDSCITCKLVKPRVGRMEAQMHPIPKVEAPWHTIHIDATGKLSGKNDQKEYVFVIIDAFTKFVLLTHTINIDTKNSIQAVMKCSAIFGAPSRIIADQGRCFSSGGFKDFCKTRNIDLHLIATGAARANGQVERVMGTLKTMLTVVEASKDKSWQESLDDIQLALNCSISSTTKSSPLELMIGKTARPLALMSSEVKVKVDRDLLREKAKINIERAGEYNKQRFDATKAKVKKFSVGDFVLVRNEERNQTKLDMKFKGPLKIVEVLDGDRYVIKALDSNRTFKFAHEKLRAMPQENNQIDDDFKSDHVNDRYSVENDHSEIDDINNDGSNVVVDGCNENLISNEDYELVMDEYDENIVEEGR